MDPIAFSQQINLCAVLWYMVLGYIFEQVILHNCARQETLLQFLCVHIQSRWCCRQLKTNNFLVVRHCYYIALCSQSIVFYVCSLGR